MTFDKHVAAAVVSLAMMGAIANCSSSPSHPPEPVPVPLSCSGGTVIGSCVTGFGACNEYGGGWTLPEAQSDCAIPENAGATFQPGAPCNQTNIAGVCVSVEAGIGTIASYYSLGPFDAMTAEEACTAGMGTWCSASAFGDAGEATDSGPTADSAAPDDATLNPVDAADARPDAAAQGVDASRDATSDGRAPAEADGSVDGAESDAQFTDETAPDAPTADSMSIESEASDADGGDGASH
jgi:hypothetical protein